MSLPPCLHQLARKERHLQRKRLLFLINFFDILHIKYARASNQYNYDTKLRIFVNSLLGPVGPVGGQLAAHASLKYTKIRTLCITSFFIGFLKLAEGGGIFVRKKQCTLCYIFICKKQCTFCYVFIYKKPETLRYIFVCKTNSLCVTFLYLKCIV